MNNFEKLQAKLESEPAFAKKLVEQETAEDAQRFLKAEGMDFTVEELNSFAETVNKYEESEGELSDEDLDGVAGGVMATMASAVTSINDEIKRAKRETRRVFKRYFRSW
jgi:predicted ribosomally synthesized peptide with nif11-like leader